MKILGTKMDWQDVFQGIGLVVMTTGTAMSAMLLIIPRTPLSALNAEQLEQISLAIRILAPAAFIGGVCAIIGTVLVEKKDKQRQAEMEKEEAEEDERLRKLVKAKDHEGIHRFWEEKMGQLEKE